MTFHKQRQGRLEGGAGHEGIQGFNIVTCHSRLLHSRACRVPPHGFVASYPSLDFCPIWLTSLRQAISSQVKPQHWRDRRLRCPEQTQHVMEPVRFEYSIFDALLSYSRATIGPHRRGPKQGWRNLLLVAFSLCHPSVMLLPPSCTTTS
jgi:hypothetical protein